MSLISFPLPFSQSKSDLAQTGSIPEEERSQNTAPKSRNLMEAAFIARGESLQEVCVMTTPIKGQQKQEK